MVSILQKNSVLLKILWQVVLTERKFFNSLKDFKTILANENNANVIANFAQTYQVYNPLQIF